MKFMWIKFWTRKSMAPVRVRAVASCKYTCSLTLSLFLSLPLSSPCDITTVAVILTYSDDLDEGKRVGGREWERTNGAEDQQNKLVK